MATNTNVYDISDLEAIEEEECRNVSVVTQLSPMKTGKNKKVKYFHGKLTDAMKLVGFEPKLRTCMDKAHARRKKDGGTEQLFCKGKYV